MNSVNLLGRLTKDIDLRYSQSGTAVATGTIAVTRKYTNQKGERESDFIRFKAFKKTAELIANIKKGQQLGLSGSWQTGSYQDQNGGTIYTNDLFVEQLTFVSGQNNANTGNQAQVGTNTLNSNQNANNQSNFNAQGGLGADPMRDRQDPFANGQEIDDDLPF